MSKYELHTVELKRYGFKFQVVRLPEEVVEDKLALTSTDTGLISRMEYQDFLFSECVVNIDRVFKFIADVSEDDINLSIVIRNEIEECIVKVNPKLNPDRLIINENGVIKHTSKAEGTPLTENGDWNETIEDINPHLNNRAASSDIDKKLNKANLPSINGRDLGDFIEYLWARTGLVVKVRKFSPKDLSDIFSDKNVFGKELYYKAYIIIKSVVSGEEVLCLADAMGVSEDIGSEAVVDELYGLCIATNPFLDFNEIDLSDVRKKQTRSNKKKSRSKAKSKKKEEPKDAKLFSSVPKTELLSLGERMKRRIIGQDHAIDQIVDSIQIASCGLREEEQPIATYLLCGTTGVGKTECSKVLAEELCGGKEHLVRVDCSEYTQAHDVQRLVGAPPSYVGHEDGGFLTNAIKDYPFAVVLFDEIEKAHNNLFNILLQITDDARLTDGKGNTTDFSNTIILLTSNIGVEETESVKKTIGFGDANVLTEEKEDKALKDALKGRFRPEFLNRLDNVIKFKSLDHEDALSVVGLMLDKVVGYLANKEITAEFSDDLKEKIFELGFSKEFGARPLKRTIDKKVIRALAHKMLEDELVAGDDVIIDWKDDNIVIEKKENKEVNTNAQRTAV